jgi:hypothetical protein
MSKQQEYDMIYESKVTNALVRVKNKPNIELVAKAIIKLEKNIEIQNQKERGENK